MIKEKVNRKRLSGIVVASKMQKTLVVKVARLVAHPIYKKRFVISKHYKAHYDNGEYKKGDKVTIEETRPVSKDKKWKVVN